MADAFSLLGNAPITDDTNYLTDEIQFDIDSNLRTIAIPTAGVVIGVTGDKNVNRVNFRMPAWYNGFDMSKFSPRINFIDPEGNVNYYTVTDMTVYNSDNEIVTGIPTTSDTIYFTWLVDSYATKYVGSVVFNVRFTKFNSTTNALEQAFNTTKATCTVLEGITLAGEISQDEQEDLLFHMTAELQDVTDGLELNIQQKGVATLAAIEAKGETTLESIPDDYSTLSSEVSDVKSDLYQSLDLTKISKANNIIDTSSMNGKTFAVAFPSRHNYINIANKALVPSSGMFKGIIEFSDGTYAEIGTWFAYDSDNVQLNGGNISKSTAAKQISDTSKLTKIDFYWSSAEYTSATTNYSSKVVSRVYFGIYGSEVIIDDYNVKYYTKIDDVSEMVTDKADINYTVSSGYRWNGSATLEEAVRSDAIEITITNESSLTLTGSFASSLRCFYVYSNRNEDFRLNGHYNDDVPCVVIVPSNCIKVKITAMNDTFSDFQEYFTAKGSADVFFKAGKRSDLKKLDKRISKLEKGESGEVPIYWISTLDDKVSAINTIIHNAGQKANISTFFVTSDQHYPENAKVTPSLMKYISQKCGITTHIDCGDVISDAGTHSGNILNLKDGMDALIASCDKVITTQGNHDNGCTIARSGVLDASRLVTDSEWLLNTNNRLSTTPNINYYSNGKALCYDDDIAKIRYIGIDAFEDRQYTIVDGKITEYTFSSVLDTQVEWIRSCFNNVPTGYHVATYSHIALIGPIVNGKNIEIYLNCVDKADQIIPIITQFKSNGGKYIGHFAGHLHHDFMTTTNGFTEINMLNDGLHWREKTYWESIVDSATLDIIGDAPLKESGTTNECAFDVAIVNRDTQHVDLVRIGAGSNRSFNY